MDWPIEVYLGIGFFLGFVLDLIPCLYEAYYCRRAKHICADCKAWSCQGKHCDYKRKQKQGGGADDGQT